MDILSEIKSTGLKATQPRLKVLQAFQKSGRRHMTAEDVFRLLLAERFDIGLATVYRVLAQFEQARILKRNHFEAGKATYELADESHHDHLVCLACGKVEEFFDAAIERRQRAIALERGWTLQTHAMALYGHCAECRKKG
ncbi:MAG: ferric iron uptake transcriptional regulator [Burkholderiaceae bacterium]|nr:ferric iron uptake transcriptional regulator [Burkholderiaceae bacterium]